MAQGHAGQISPLLCCQHLGVVGRPCLRLRHPRRTSCRGPLGMQSRHPRRPAVDGLDGCCRREINTFQEVSFKTAPKSVILSNFLQVDPSEEENSTSQSAQNGDDRDKKSVSSDVSLGTETLAVILENQGRYDKALAIYKNLLANNPEKSSIFAPRIERLTSLINSK